VNLRRIPSLPGRLVAATAILAALHVALCVLYAFPSLSQRQYAIPGRISVVSYVEGHGYYWSVGFGAVAVALVLAAVSGRMVSVAHVLGGAVMMAYTMALAWGALASHPHGPLVSAALAAMYAFLHLIIANTYVAVEHYRQTTYARPE
jgi:hypothetical protein